MDCVPKALPFAADSLQGLSQRLIDSHYRNNYGGAVARFNAIARHWRELDPTLAPNFQLNGLQREALIAANSMQLHERYFDNLGGNGQLADGPLKTILAASFGSFDRWRQEFVAMARALGGGSGWLMLSWMPRAGRLVNQWAADHAHLLADSTPLIALDMYEHAYHLDYGANAAAYVEAFLQNLHWDRIADRFEEAVAMSSASIALEPDALADDDARWQVLDVRRRAVYEANPERLPDARWFDPEQLAAWRGQLDNARPAAVYCVHGHAISRVLALQLRLAGVDAHFIAGGLERWRSEGRAIA